MEQFLSPEAIHQREAPADAEPVVERTVDLSFSSETPVERYDWRREEPYDEVLDHTPDAVDLERLQTVGCVFFNHDSYGMPVARIEKVWLDQESRRCRARIVFDDDAESDRVFRKVKSGSLRGVSVGYRVQQWERTEEKGQRAVMHARRWEPLEFSIVSVPADASVGVGRSMTIREEKTMANNEERTMEGTGAADVGVNPRQQEPQTAQSGERQNDVQSILEDERARVAEITDACRAFDMDPGEFIRSGAGIDEVNAAIVKAQRAARKPIETGASRSAVSVTADESDKFRAAAADGLRLRLGVRMERPAEGAEAFRGAHLIDLAREVLERRGDHIGYGVSHLDLAARAMATSDFPIILGNVANATLKEAYTAAPSTWQAWCATGSLSDFKEQSIVRLSETGDLELVPEGGEYRMADFTEARDSIRLYTYGKKFSLTRQAIVNDDLRAFTRLPARFGSAAARTINRAVYALLTGSPVIAEDGKPLFHASHKNLASPGTLFCSDALSAARTAMRRQKGLRGEDALNISPSYVIVPPELETIVEKLLKSDTDLNATAAGIRNVFKNSLTMITDAELADAKTWYLAANPSMIDTVEVGFLDGVSSPMIEQRNGWDVDGIEYKIRLDFGVKVWDYRGLYKNPGAAE